MNSTGAKVYTDQEIINRLRESGIDQRRSEDELFNRFSYFIREGMNKHALSEDESFNAYSDTILAALENIRNTRFEARSSLKTYLFQIFHNKCVDLIRKKTTNKSSVNRTISIPEVLTQVADSSKTVIQQMMDLTDKETIRQKLSELGDSCRKMLWQWAEGYSDKEIAAALDYKTADVVKTSRLRCLEKLRQLYKTQAK